MTGSPVFTLARFSKRRFSKPRFSLARYLALSMLIPLGLVMVARAEEPRAEEPDEIYFHDDYNKALREAKLTQKPIFLEFRCAP